MAADGRLPIVIMIRHAQSEWNREGRFTGWADPALTEAGHAGAVQVGQQLARQGFRFDAVYCSRLRRARDTARAVLSSCGAGAAPLTEDWRLNERHYGALQGERKATVIARVGEAQVWRWRRGYRDRPPGLASGHPKHPARDPKWAGIDPRLLPNGESLAQTRLRVMRFWDELIQPQILPGRRLLIASHGNTLRALIMALQGMDPRVVESFEIPTGVPIAHLFSAGGSPLGWHYLDTGGRRAA